MNITKIRLAVTTLAISFILGGCATAEQKPQTVYVPVVASKPALPARPHLAIAELSEDSPADAVMKAYAESVLQCTGYATQLEALLK